MVESDGIAGSDANEPGAGEAAQALRAILQTQYLRYVIIASWALGLLAVVPWTLALSWFVVTMVAGSIRGLVERRLSQSVDAGFGMIFPAVATVTTAAWALAPLTAWFSEAAAGPMVGIALLISGYLLVFAQLRTSPKQALVISSPYTLVALVIGASLWGTPAFFAFLAMLPFTAAGLFVLVTMTALREDRIRAFQAHQAHLIEELEHARDRANAASEAKSNFLGVISHELRTPMNGVLGAAQLLDMTRLEPAQKEYVSIIRGSGDNLLSLLNDILDMSKIEAGKMKFESIDVSTADLHRKAVLPFQANAQAKGVDFVINFDGQLPAVVRGDPLRICQVLQNLLSNAVKFTERGSITYTVKTTRLADDRARFEFSVKDSGSGISAEDLPRLFQPFTQVDASSTRKFGGTGLGLSIAGRLAEAMGGDIEVESEVGKGSTFTLTLTAKVVRWESQRVAEAAEVAAGADRPLSVLVVEDHPVNRMILDSWLRSAGHRCVQAENGRDALDVLSQRVFDLIIMDVNMPVMDGLAATRALRSVDGPNRDTPLVVLSASARMQDHLAGLDAGADAYLNKPIDFAALAGVMGLAGAGRQALRNYTELQEAA